MRSVIYKNSEKKEKDTMTTSWATYQEKLATANEILIVYGAEADLPVVAVATSLYLWLQAQGKTVTLVSPAMPIVDFSHLVGINKVKNKLVGENLVVTLPMKASEIEAVVSDYQMEADELSLVVKPKKGQRWGKIDKLAVDYLPPDYDAVIYLDVSGSQELAGLIAGADKIWQEPAKNITINSYARPTTIKANISETLGKQTGFATYWTKIWREAGVKIDDDLASNLLAGLERESRDFAAEFTSAEVFELAAWLLRQGGRRYLYDRRAQADFQARNHLPERGELNEDLQHAQVDLTPPQMIAAE